VTRVKICGITTSDHALGALDAGVDLLGFVFYPPSHRYVEPLRAAQIVADCRARFPGSWAAVGVFVNVPLEAVNRIARLARLDLVQLAGEESAAYCRSVERPVVKVVRVRADGSPSGPTDASAWQAERILLDTQRAGSYGGTGEAYDWSGVRPYARDALLAGGLTPANVRRAIQLAQPWDIDVSSGVERHKQKDPRLIRDLLLEVKGHVGAR